ncbi:glucuronate isomerase [Butyricicoccus sp.]|uniref:glucuronate isomerase n=1 Tax=Butyricicoccus sp. TaxID=2049021 RepID=UPI003735DCC1
MKPFMDEDFLLSTETAKKLYHEIAEQMPIIDYHCHINPQEIAEDRKFDNISQVWLGGDHYKWRVMRAAGTTEDKVTGDADDREKFRAFAATMPQLIGNPLYHWSHLELQRGFGITEPLTPDNADEIYDKCNEILKGYSARSLMEKFNVKAICTTDDPVDDLHWHDMIAADESFSIKVLPAFRPDKAVNIEKPGFDAYIQKLSGVVGRELTSAEDVAAALCERIDYFNAKGCLCADHGLDYCMYAAPDAAAANEAFALAMSGKKPEKALADAYKTLVTIACAKKYTELDWVMQIHFGCLRDNNKPQFAKLGPDTGYDAVNSQSGVENVAPLLNAFAENDGLPKVILYSLNPVDNTAIATIMACFQGGGIAGKMQQGSAWWFNDNRPGMRQQLTDLASNGVLGRFVGMLTDSRSFLSYTRHEYFRRVLCELLGEWVESGQYPSDEKQLRKLVEDLCYNNTNEFFRFGV